MKILTKSTFCRKHTPLKYCNSAPFGVLWTDIDQVFWPKKWFQNFHWFPHCKWRHFPLFYKTLQQIVGIFSLNLFLVWCFLTPWHSEFQKMQCVECILLILEHPIPQLSLANILSKCRRMLTSTDITNVSKQDQWW